ncbi:hypothetical protein [Clostridium sp. HBUAS56010]|uniref:hypothetical protein n=1 Tax=Clostridium sp. HBUAS56010 TaxID=2571127 RepID=UPI001177ADF2|nr:hypothetical protein [Clostridium sp. HBUAS56010]
MDIFAFIGAFGGGIIGAYLGALPAFILTGLLAIAGAVVAMAGGGDVTIGYVAFGSYLGPHVAFAGGVAAAAYAGKKKLLKSGTDILSPLFGLNDPMTLVVGGVFGVLGFVIHYGAGSVLRLNTDLPGITVVISGLIARFAFGSSGLIGKTESGEKREYITLGKGLFCNVLLGGGIGTATGFVYQTMAAAGASEAAIGNFPVLCFGIAAFSLMFTQTGFAVPSTHHIALISALAAVISGNPLMGVVFGILTALFGDFIVKTLNSHCDTHVDPPACTIFIFTFLVNILFGNGFFLP